uniref:Uncharacterized protein n=1 Tax=Acrobeloides nanus TaxID=290746 RepID=A0A914BZ22_9BILA
MHALIILLPFLPLIEGVIQCPLGGIGGYGGGYGGGPGYPFGGGNYCGPESIFHYYTCCNNGYECCFQLETWVIVGLIVLALVTIVCCFGICGACYWGVARATE